MGKRFDPKLVDFLIVPTKNEFLSIGKIELPDLNRLTLDFLNLSLLFEVLGVLHFTKRRIIDSLGIERSR